MAIRTVYRGNARYYVSPENPEVQYPGVTSVINMLSKPFLQAWAARMTAELAVDSLEIIQQMAERDRQGAVDYLRDAARRYTRLRAGIGSDAHDLFERMIRGETPTRVHPDMEPYRRHFAEFLDAVQPELIRAEDTAWSSTHEYAGSFDAILRLRLDDNGKPSPDGDPAVVIADWKTSRSTYPEVALQMSAYASADEVIAPDGAAEPMPAVDGACVLHITQDNWAFKPVRIDRPVFETFLHLRAIFDWDRELSRAVLGDPIARGRRLVTGTQRRAR